MNQIRTPLNANYMNQDVIDKLINILIALGLSLLAISVMGVIFKSLFGHESLYPEFSKHPIPLNYLFYMCTIVPIFEEMCFRHIPTTLLKRTEIFNIKNNKWYFIVLIGIVFGWMHGSVINVYCQGIVGMLLGWVYIKNNYSYLSAVVTHSLYNFMVAFILPILIN